MAGRTRTLDDVDLWPLVAAERRDLTDFLETLEPEQWDTRSLCSAWRVRDVVAHLTLESRRRPVAVRDVLRARFRFNTAADSAARRTAAIPTRELLAAFTATIDSRTKPPFVPKMAMLADPLIHAQDIRRPLGAQRQVPEERIIPSLDFLSTLGFPVGARRRIAGLRLEASDIGWSTGDGPTVRGPAEALLLSMAGRSDALKELHGEGAGVLSARVAVSARDK